MERFTGTLYTTPDDDNAGTVHLHHSYHRGYGTIYGDDGKGKILAKRIVSCVNACAGMEDPAAEIAAKDERIRVLENALRPFAEHADHYRISDIPRLPTTTVGHYFVTVEELRIARAAIKSPS